MIDNVEAASELFENIDQCDHPRDCQVVFSEIEGFEMKQLDLIDDFLNCLEVF